MELKRYVDLILNDGNDFKILHKDGSLNAKYDGEDREHETEIIKMETLEDGSLMYTLKVKNERWLDM